VAKRTKLSVKDKKWYDLQGDIQDRIDEDFLKISKIFDGYDANGTFLTYFLMFWSRVLKFEESQDSEYKYAKLELISSITNMMNGNLPDKMDNEDTRTLN
jgi:hypothetical protein